MIKYFSTKKGHNYFFAFFCFCLFFFRRKAEMQTHLVFWELQEKDGFLSDIFVPHNADFANCIMIVDFKNDFCL